MTGCIACGEPTRTVAPGVVACTNTRCELVAKVPAPRTPWQVTLDVALSTAWNDPRLAWRSSHRDANAGSRAGYLADQTLAIVASADTFAPRLMSGGYAA